MTSPCRLSTPSAPASLDQRGSAERGSSASSASSGTLDHHAVERGHELPTLGREHGFRQLGRDQPAGSCHGAIKARDGGRARVTQVRRRGIAGDMSGIVHAGVLSPAPHWYDIGASLGGNVMEASDEDRFDTIVAMRNPCRHGQRRSPRRPDHDIVMCHGMGRPLSKTAKHLAFDLPRNHVPVERVRTPSFVWVGLAIASVFRSPRSLPTSMRSRRTRLLRGQAASATVRAGDLSRHPGSLRGNALPFFPGLN